MTGDKASIVTDDVSVLLVSGLSGAGRGSILRALEDLGHQAVDNLPLALLPDLVAEARRENRRLAVGVDTRTQGFDPQALLRAVEDLRLHHGAAVGLIMATASDDVLLRRFTETRRRHPLAPEGGVLDGILAERRLLAPLQPAADLTLDTSDLPLAALREAIERRFGGRALSVTLMSFAFPNGLPREADMVFDARFLRNPHYDPRLRPLTGLDPEVGAYVAADPDFEPFMERMAGLLRSLLPRFKGEGKKYLTVAVGCSGGRHRSAHIVETLARRLAGFPGAAPGSGIDSKTEWNISVQHRELGARASQARTMAP